MVSWLRVIVILLQIACIWCLRIIKFVGPKILERGSTQRLILDCPYVLSRSDEKKSLVIKWYYNDITVPIYQWIPGNKPQDLIFFKGRLDLSYKASRNTLEVHRALAIRNPDTGMTGNYTCSVATFDTEDLKSSSILIYAPAKSVRLKFHRINTTDVELRCHVKNVYPQPHIRLYRDLQHPDTKLDGLLTFTSNVGEHPSFDVIYKHSIKRRELEEDNLFICVVSLPGTDYITQTELIFSTDAFDVSVAQVPLTCYPLVFLLLVISLKVTLMNL